MKNRILFAFVMISFFGCTTTSFRLKEEMLPDGTWKITTPQKSVCEESSSKAQQVLRMNDARKAFEKDEVFQSHEEASKVCLGVERVLIEERAKELCSTSKYRLFGCFKSSEEKSFSFREVISCYVKCGG